jgi:hypothetical protein
LPLPLGGAVVVEGVVVVGGAVVVSVVVGAGFGFGPGLGFGFGFGFGAGFGFGFGAGFGFGFACGGVDAVSVEVSGRAPAAPVAPEAPVLHPVALWARVERLCAPLRSTWRTLASTEAGSPPTVLEKLAAAASSATESPL